MQPIRTTEHLRERHSRERHSRKRAPLLGMAALAALGLAAARPAQAQTTLSTLAQSSAGDAVYPWGVTDTSTFGQTFTAPTSNVLNDFTFYLGDDPGDTIKYKSYVYAWDGSKASGPALFTSAAQTYTGAAAGVFKPVFTNAGGTVLTAGQKYVAFLTTAGLQAGRPLSGAGWAITDDFQSAYSGGDLVYSNTGNNFGALTTHTWDDKGSAVGTSYDAKFKMDFSPSNVPSTAPEPSPLAALAFTTLGLAGLTLKARRRKSLTA